MKPKDQVIDVEKPRERPTLWRPDGEAKEILPGAVKDEDRDPREVGGGAREVVVRPDRIPPRPPPRASQRASSGVNVEIGGSAPRREPKIPEGLRDVPEENEDRPVDRPRTFAQRRQMEEERANRERNGFDPESPDPFKPEE